MPRATLELLGSGSPFELTRIGRGSQCEFAVPVLGLSREHATWA